MSRFKYLSSAIALIALAALLFGLDFVQLPFINVGLQPTATEVTVKPKDLSVSCPGAALRLGGSSGDKVGKLDRIGSATFSFRSNLSGSQTLVAKLLSDSAVTNLPASSVTSSLVRAEGLSLTAHDETGSTDQSSDVLAAVQTQKLSTDSASGLIGAACQPAGYEQWLVGAETLTGRESILILQNNTGLDSTVDVDFFTDGGKLSATGATGIAVSANSFEAVPISSYAPKAKTIAVHVTSRGGAISSWIQQKTTRGLSRGGADFITSQIELSNQLAIPGLSIAGSALAEKLIAQNSDYRDLIPSLHVFVPGDKDATLTAQIISSTENAFGTVLKQTVAAGKVNRFEMPGLTDGDYVVLIDSDQPIFAEVLMSRVSVGKSPDIAYLAPAQLLTKKRAAVSPAGANSRLSLVNPGDAPVTIKLSGLSNTTISLDKFSSVSLPVIAGNSFSIESDAPVASALVIDSAAGVTVAQTLDYSNTGKTVSVLVR